MPQNINATNTEAPDTLSVPASGDAPSSYPNVVKLALNALLSGLKNVRVRLASAETSISALQAGGGGGGSGLPFELNAFGGQRLLGTYAPSNAVPTISRVVPIGTTPMILRGAAGTASAGDVRDQATTYAHGRYWMLATTAQGHTNPPFNVTLSLYSNTEDRIDAGQPWTAHGVVVSPNPTPGQWDSGARYSPGLTYDNATGEAWVPYSGTPTDAGWYGGLSKIGMIRLAPGADWTDPATWQVQNGGNPVLEASQSWEGGQGVYSPALFKLSENRWMMAYNTNVGAAFGGASNPKVGVAFAVHPLGPWTPYAGNPVMPVVGASKTEEFAGVQMPNGWWLSILDEALGDASARAGVYVSTPTDPLSPVAWTRTGAQPLVLPTWAAGQVGSSALTVSPASGRVLWTFSGKPLGQSSDQRHIGGAWIEIEGTEAHVARVARDGYGTVGGVGAANGTAIWVRDTTQTPFQRLDGNLGANTIVSLAIPASASARTYLVSGSCVWTGGTSVQANMHLILRLDGVREWPKNPVYTYTGTLGTMDDGESNRAYFADIPTVAITVPGDNAPHTISLVGNAAASLTPDVTLLDRTLAALQIV